MLEDLAAELRSATDADAGLGWLDRFARECGGLQPRGYGAREIDEQAQRVRVGVPAVVRGWYESFARTKGVAFGQNYVVPPDQWSVAHGRLRIGVENQGNWNTHAALGEYDPPVFVEEERLALLSSAFSIYAVQTALFEHVMTAAGRGGCNGPASKEATRWLAEGFGEPVVAPWPKTGPGPIDFYMGRCGVAFHEKSAENEWLFLALVDDYAIRREVERSAPVQEWIVSPLE